MSGKSKHVEVASARFRLDATLQNLVDKKDDGFAASDGEGSNLQPDFPSTASPAQSPRKAGKSRKRKRKDDSSDFPVGAQQQHFVMKLFDRSVDLAQFDEESPLYPICRAWIKNQPNGTHVKEERPGTPPPPPTDSQTEEGEIPDVYDLPAPVKDEYSYVDINRRIPIPLAQPAEKLDIHQDPEQAPPPEQLLLDHMVRWKQTRKLWKNAGAANELRYSASMNLLQDMYEKAMSGE